jgi:hypothetical protein
MAYNITLTNGHNLVTVADGTTESNFTSLTLIGKNFAGYGAFLNENFVKLLENFSNSTAPSNPLAGQLWWDSVNKSLKVYSANVWKTVSSSTAASTSPAGAITGDLWWDTSAGGGQLKVWDGTAWVVIGPAFTAVMGQTGILAKTIAESGNASAVHIVVYFYVNNTVVAILSKDPSFDVSSEPGFTTINPGFNLSSTNNLAYYGNANNALSLGGVLAANYLKSNIDQTTQGAFTVQGGGGLTVGAGGDFNVSTTTTAVNVVSAASGKDMKFWVNVSGISKNLLTLNGTSGAITVLADPTTDMGVATRQYVDNVLTGSGSTVLKRDGTNTITGVIVPDGNGTRNFGSASSAFNNIYAVHHVGNLTGTADNALALNGVPYTSYARTDAAPTFLTNAGLTLGTGSDFTIDVTASPNAVNLKSNTQNKSININVNRGGTPTTAIAIDGTTGLATVVGDPTSSLGIATRQYVDSHSGIVNLTSVAQNILPSQNLTYSIGSGTMKWTDIWATTFHGNASTANYADLAERFASDQPYSPGTVVELGGAAEITKSVTELSDNVFGVISTKAAYLMNAGAGTDTTHPPIAIQGRVPVRVIGVVRKGDRLVSAGNGLARAASRSEITSFNVIGRALEDKLTSIEGTVEAIVKLNS